MSFGEKLLMLREKAGITQEALAQKIGISKQNISRYENSNREPNIRTAKKIADALGVPLEELTSDRSKESVFYQTDVPPKMASRILKTIEECMRERDLTVSDLACELDVPIAYIADFFGHDFDALSDSQVVKLCNIVGCNYRVFQGAWLFANEQAGHPLSAEEVDLIFAWRSADGKTRRKVAIDLEDYGFRYHPKE